MAEKGKVKDMGFAGKVKQAQQQSVNLENYTKCQFNLTFCQIQLNYTPITDIEAKDECPA
jgi:hypothetical protein